MRKRERGVGKQCVVGKQQPELLVANLGVRLWEVLSHVAGIHVGIDADLLTASDHIHHILGASVGDEVDKGALEVFLGLDLDSVNASDASEQSLKHVVDGVVREVLVDCGDVNRGDDRVFGQVQLGVLGGELVVDVKGLGSVHFRLFVRLVSFVIVQQCGSKYMLSFFLEKRFQFLGP